MIRKPYNALIMKLITSLVCT